MGQLLIILMLATVAVGVAWLLRRRQAPEPQRGPSWAVPTLLRRHDFDRPNAPWLVVVFSSQTCLACQSAWEKASLLESEAVAVQKVDSIEQKDLHQRYGIDAVPLIVVVDDTGAVRREFVGPPSVTDLWSALAELREGET